MDAFCGICLFILVTAWICRFIYWILRFIHRCTTKQIYLRIIKPIYLALKPTPEEEVEEILSPERALAKKNMDEMVKSAIAETFNGNKELGELAWTELEKYRKSLRASKRN